MSPDPILGDYLPVTPVNDEAIEYNKNLPGQGGIFNPINLNLYHYCFNNPLKYIDPTGCVPRTGGWLINWEEAWGKIYKGVKTEIPRIFKNDKGEPIFTIDEAGKMAELVADAMSVLTANELKGITENIEKNLKEQKSLLEKKEVLQNAKSTKKINKKLKKINKKLDTINKKIADLYNKLDKIFGTVINKEIPKYLKKHGTEEQNKIYAKAKEKL